MFLTCVTLAASLESVSYSKDLSFSLYVKAGIALARYNLKWVKYFCRFLIFILKTLNHNEQTRHHLDSEQLNVYGFVIKPTRNKDVTFF